MSTETILIILYLMIAIGTTIGAYINPIAPNYPKSAVFFGSAIIGIFWPIFYAAKIALNIR